jgi:hypothetical protein
MCGTIAQQLAGLQHIKRLSVYGIGPAVELKGLRQLTQLQQLQLTFELPAKRAVLQLLEELMQLQQLRQLALPAKLLCGFCCVGVWRSLEELGAQCCKNGCKLVFLKRQQRPGPQAAQAGDYCRHDERVLPALLSALRKTIIQVPQVTAVAASVGNRGTDAPAAAAASSTSMPSRQLLQLREMLQQEVPQLPEHMLRDRSCSSAWGLLGPAEEWWQ